MNIQKRIAQIRIELSVKEALSSLSTTELINELFQLEDELESQNKWAIIDGLRMPIKDALEYDFK